MSKQVSEMCKAIRDLVGRGELARQQGKTLMGQCKHGDIEGARKGLETATSTIASDRQAKQRESTTIHYGTKSKEEERTEAG